MWRSLRRPSRTGPGSRRHATTAPERRHDAGTRETRWCVERTAPADRLRRPLSVRPHQVKSSTLVKPFVLTAAILVGAFAAAIAFGGPTPPPPMASINNPFKSVDFSDLPPLLHFAAEDGAALAYTAKAIYPGWVFFGRWVCPPFRWQCQARRISELPSPLAVSEPGCAEFPSWQRRMGQRRRPSRHGSFCPESRWHPYLQRHASHQLRIERGSEVVSHSGILVRLGGKLSAAKGL